MNVSPVTIRLADAAICDLKALATIQRKCNMQMKFNGFFAAISDVSHETIEIDVDLSEFDATGHPSRSNKLFLYAGRDLYRPGESFSLSVLARDADGKPFPKPLPLTITVKKPDGSKLAEQLVQPGKTGTAYKPIGDGTYGGGKKGRKYAATVQADVWMRPCASVAGTRWTRCVPDSNFRREYAPWPSTRATTRL